jgi:hypothetical protein
MDIIMYIITIVGIIVMMTVILADISDKIRRRD